MKLYVAVLKKYAVFGGRARRQEYWTFTLVNLVASTLALLLAFVGYGTPAFYFVVLPALLLSLFSLAVLVPGLAVTVRRLHDTDRNGGWIFISLVPFAGSIILLVILATDGTGDNRYGPDPKARYAGAPSIPAGWLPDPTGRHEMRYWDTHVWTSQVADAGVASVDPAQP